MYDLLSCESLGHETGSLDITTFDRWCIASGLFSS
jgi:hypothetical protein